MSVTPARKATPTRPTLVKKQTRASKDKRQSVLDDGVRLQVGDKVYQVLAGDLNALDSRALRQQVGVTFPGLIAVLDSEFFDIDMVAALIWLRRRIDGETDLTYNTVASETGYEVLEDFSVKAPEDDADEGDLPEE